MFISLNLYFQKNKLAENKDSLIQWEIFFVVLMNIGHPGTQMWIGENYTKNYKKFAITDVKLTPGNCSFYLIGHLKGRSYYLMLKIR